MHSDSTDDYCISIDADCKLDLPTDDELLSVYRLLLLNAEHLMPWMDWVDKITFSSQRRSSMRGAICRRKRALNGSSIWKESPWARVRFAD